MDIDLKAAVVGDGSVGKTCLLIRFCSDKFDHGYTPTVFDTYDVNLVVDHKAVRLSVWDTAGQPEYDRLRPLSYLERDIVLICFSIDNRASYENVWMKWQPEISQFLPDTLIVLVGTKSDLRTDPTTTSTTYSEGQELAKKIHAKAYLECSTILNVGIREVFETAVRAKLNDMEKKSRKSKPKCITS